MGKTRHCKLKDDGGETDDVKEVIPEEVKKPRYFPPRKLPNPFESAALEQERFI